MLLVDDEPKIRRFLCAGFELEGYVVLEAANAADALRITTFNSPDLIILDLKLPDIPGAEVLERIRSWSNVPVIILSVVAGEDEKVKLLRAGADHYVVKPFSMPELLARSEALLRRYFKAAAENAIVIAGPLSVNFITREVLLDEKPVGLTRKEYYLLHILAMHVGLRGNARPVAQCDLDWTAARKNSISAHPRAQTEQKMETDPDRPRLLITESGVGYRLQSPLETAPAEG